MRGYIEQKHMASTFHLLEVENYKLTYFAKEYCDRDISIQELTDAIKLMKPNKSPGLMALQQNC